MQSSLIIGRDQPLINGSTINARDGKRADWLWLIENVELELDSKEASCCSAYPIPDGRCDPDGNSGPERMGKGRLERTEVNLVCELVLSTLLKSHLSQVRGFPLDSPPLCLPLLHLGNSFIYKIEAGNFTKHHNFFFFFYKNSSNSWGDRTYQELMSFLHVVTSFDFFSSGNFLLLRSRSGLYRSLVPQDPMTRAWTVFMILWGESFERLFILSSSLALLIFERCLKCLQSRMQEL